MMAILMVWQCDVDDDIHLEFGSGDDSHNHHRHYSNSLHDHHYQPLSFTINVMIIMAAIITLRMVVRVMITDTHSPNGSVLFSCVALATSLSGRVTVTGHGRETHPGNLYPVLRSCRTCWLQHNCTAQPWAVSVNLSIVS